MLYCKLVIWIVALVLAVVSAVVAVIMWHQHLVAERYSRESHFITVHFLAVEAASDYAGADGPQDIDALLAHFGGKDSRLLRPFPDGLVYRWDNGNFTLEEPVAQRISLLKKDRLIATDRKWPRWESSGEYARKFPEQQVPPSGYE